MATLTTIRALKMSHVFWLWVEEPCSIKSLLWVGIIFLFLNFLWHPPKKKRYSFRCDPPNLQSPPPRQKINIGDEALGICPQVIRIALWVLFLSVTKWIIRNYTKLKRKTKNKLKQMSSNITFVLQVRLRVCVVFLPLVQGTTIYLQYLQQLIMFYKYGLGSVLCSSLSYRA